MTTRTTLVSIEEWTTRSMVEVNWAVSAWSIVTPVLREHPAGCTPHRRPINIGQSSSSAYAQTPEKPTADWEGDAQSAVGFTSKSGSLAIGAVREAGHMPDRRSRCDVRRHDGQEEDRRGPLPHQHQDRKSTRLNSS